MDGNSADEFVTVYRFMTCGLGLRGSDLLVYARIFSFCHEPGGRYFESAERCAEFLNMSERQVRRSISNLRARGLIVEAPSPGARQSTSRTYTLSRQAVRDAIGEVESARPGKPQRTKCPGGGSYEDRLSPGPDILSAETDILSARI